MEKLGIKSGFEADGTPPPSREPTPPPSPVRPPPGRKRRRRWNSRRKPLRESCAPGLLIDARGLCAALHLCSTTDCLMVPACFSTWYTAAGVTKEDMEELEDVCERAADIHSEVGVATQPPAC